MPSFTITLSAQAVARLQAVVDRYNANTGQTLTVRDWITLHVKEVAIADDLMAEHQRLQRKHEESLRAAVEAARKGLIDGLA